MTQNYTTFRAMGCQFQIWLETELDGASILQEASAWVEALEARLSRFRETSELSCLNGRSGRKTPVSDVMLDVILVALDAARHTKGACTPLILPALIAAGYDQSFELIQERTSTGMGAPQFYIAVPDWQDVEVFVDESAVRLPPGAQLDLGGIGKGWTAESIADRLESFGPCLVDAGGDIVARGRPLGAEGWRVQVADPSMDNCSLVTLTLNNQAVATSGVDFRRWQLGGQTQHHLIDPRTGKPAITDVLSATVINVDADRAEACAKALVILGSDAGLQWFAENSTGSALVIRQDGAVLATENLEGILEVEQDPVYIEERYS